jgi:hypothetical protein
MTGSVVAADDNVWGLPDAHSALRFTLDKPNACFGAEVTSLAAVLSVALTEMDGLASCAVALGSRKAKGIAAKIRDWKARTVFIV